MSKQTDDVVPQIAALPMRWEKGKPRVLMVTSRATRRWVMPKGWLMDGKKPWRAAEIEALEEAGALGVILREPVGHYHYMKKLPKGKSCRCRVTVYPMMVERLKRNWKERSERRRKWFSPAKAAKLVKEAELGQLLEALAEDTKAPARLRRSLRKAS